MTNIYIGVLSGTSMDAVDVAAFTFNNSSAQLIASHSLNLPTDYKSRYLKIIDEQQCTLNQLGTLDHDTGELIATAVLNFLDQQKMSAQDITAIGSHGQTLWHAPNGTKPFTIQLGDPNIIAAKTGIKTVADFRRADIAAGGQGAPLAPAFHKAVFSSLDEDRCIVNIGGISNVSVLHDNEVLGFDTGPGNCLLDLCAQQHFNIPYDKDGAIASTGIVDQNLLTSCLSDPYFSKAAPKSSGREYFNATWLQNQLNKCSAKLNPADILATLTNLTAQNIATAIQQLSNKPAVYLCGGGARNSSLCNILNNILGTSVQTTACLGIDPQWVEAGLFAWLAKQAVEGNRLDLKSITGSSKPVLLGGIY